MKRFIAAGAVVVAAGAGCSSTTQDLEGIDAKNPDKTEVYQQPDQFPNVGRTCIDGVAFFISTRDYEPIERVPEWDDWCEAGKS